MKKVSLYFIVTLFFFSAHASDKDVFVDRYFKNAVQFKSASDVRRFAYHQSKLDGVYMELGVFKGDSINVIADFNPRITIYGFDSFQGLPLDWSRADVNMPKGTFKIDDPNYMPSVRSNVTLFKGLFSETLPIFKKDVLKERPIAFLHVDCDIYESTHEAFLILGDNIVIGTIIVFDELYNYDNYENHEWKALQELLNRNHYEAEFIAFNSEHEQAALRIVE